MKALPLGIIVLDSVRNSPDALAPFVPYVNRVLGTIARGELIEIHSGGQVVKVN